jgi:hypothetical protein
LFQKQKVDLDDGKRISWVTGGFLALQFAASKKVFVEFGSVHLVCPVNLTIEQ